MVFLTQLYAHETHGLSPNLGLARLIAGFLLELVAGVLPRGVVFPRHVNGNRLVMKIAVDGIGDFVVRERRLPAR